MYYSNISMGKIDYLLYRHRKCQITSKFSYQQSLKVLFAAHELEDGQIALIFSAATALGKTYQLIPLPNSANFTFGQYSEILKRGFLQKNHFGVVP
jgi:hypothetical protein